MIEEWSMSTATVELDSLDTLAASMFSGYLVRKDLMRNYARQYSIPTYVVEFLLRRFCATVDEFDIAMGLQIVEQQLEGRTVKTGQEQIFKHRAREKGSIRLIDLLKAKSDTQNDGYIAELSSLALKDVQISDRLVRDHARMLTNGFYAEVTLEYDAIVAQEQHGRPFRVAGLCPIQMSKSDVLTVFFQGRAAFSTAEWIDFLIRSIGLEPKALTERARNVALLRMVPFVERNYHLVELGPQGTGKSYLFQQISPYSCLVSGGETTVAKMFGNNASGNRGHVCQYDVVCVDEISGVSFDQLDGVKIMKGYMSTGELGGGTESVRAEGSIAMVGTFDVGVEQPKSVGHLLSALPKEMRDNTAFHDCIHAYVPGWEFPKLNPNEHITQHFGLVGDFLSECWSRLRSTSRLSTLQNRVFFGDALTGRDIDAVNMTADGLLKLLFPDPSASIPDDDLESIVRISLESRRRVKEQQTRCLESEFQNTNFSYTLGVGGVEQFVSTPELDIGG
jgi:ATP-dependent Lon protease